MICDLLIRNMSIEYNIVNLLKRFQQTIAVAESMSGGVLASRLTTIAGSSKVLMGDLIVYSIQAKEMLTRLKLSNVLHNNTVSANTTIKLAYSVKQILGTTWGLAITGHAGPSVDDGSLIQVGMYFVALVSPLTYECKQFYLASDRIDIQLFSVSTALNMLYRQLLLIL